MDHDVSNLANENGLLNQYNRRLEHPNLVSLKGICRDPFSLVMELMTEGTLYEMLHKPPATPIAWERKFDIAIDIAKGMNYLHSFNPPVIHRDLKSSNVLVHILFSLSLFPLSSLSPSLPSLPLSLPLPLSSLSPSLSSLSLSSLSLSSLSPSLYIFKEIIFVVKTAIRRCSAYIRFWSLDRIFPLHQRPSGR